MAKKGMYSCLNVNAGCSEGFDELNKITTEEEARLAAGGAVDTKGLHKMRSLFSKQDNKLLQKEDNMYMTVLSRVSPSPSTSKL